MEADGIGGEVINLGGGNRISIQKLAEWIIEETGVDIEPIYTAPQRGDFPHTLADFSKAHDKLGFKAKVELKDGLRHFIDWFNQEHE